MDGENILVSFCVRETRSPYIKGTKPLWRPSRNSVINLILGISLLVLYMEEAEGVVIYAVKMYLACVLMLKTKLLPVLTELVVILNHSGVIHL